MLRYTQVNTYLLLQFLLTLADPPNLGVCVNDRRYAVVVDVCRTTADALDTKYTCQEHNGTLHSLALSKARFPLPELTA